MNTGLTISYKKESFLSDISKMMQSHLIRQNFLENCRLGGAWKQPLHPEICVMMQWTLRQSHHRQLLDLLLVVLKRTVWAFRTRFVQALRCDLPDVHQKARGNGVGEQQILAKERALRLSQKAKK